MHVVELIYSVSECCMSVSDSVPNNPTVLNESEIILISLQMPGP